MNRNYDKGEIKMNKQYFQRVQEQTATRFWINNVTRTQASQAIQVGAIGCTQNPSYTWKMMNDAEEKRYVDELLSQILLRETDDNMALVTLQRELIGNIARIFKPIYDASHGRNGFVSIQGDPFREDTNSILESARFNRQAGENIMVKVPVVETGLQAIETLIKEYIPINATECMALQQVIDVCELYDITTRNMVNPAPLYYSVITGIFDEYLKNVVEKEEIDISPDVLWQGGMIVAKKAYEIVKAKKYDCHFIGGGARGLHHFTEMVGADCAITINWNGTADKLLEADYPVVSRFFCPSPAAVVDELIAKIPDFRKAYFIRGITLEEYESYGPVVLFRSRFEKAWQKALDEIGNRRS